MPPGVIEGMNGFSALQALPASELNQQLAAMQADGVQMVRSDAPWANIEPSPPGPSGPTWNFAGMDAWVTALANNNLTWEPVIDYSVWWAGSCGTFCAPDSDQTFATFAQAVAARYGAGGSFWSQHPELPYYPAQIFEIWNEENSSAFYVSPDRYATLYAAARDSIHAIDSQARVIVGGLAESGGIFDPTANSPASYVQAMLASDPALKGQVDGYGLHPYGASAADVEDWVVNFRLALVNAGEDSAPIYITEFGWPMNNAADEAYRATQMTALSSTLTRSNCGVAMVAPYTWINPGSRTERRLRPCRQQWNEHSPASVRSRMVQRTHQRGFPARAGAVREFATRPPGIHGSFIPADCGSADFNRSGGVSGRRGTRSD